MSGDTHDHALTGGDVEDPDARHARRDESSTEPGRVPPPSVAVVVGNPKPRSRTLEAAVHVARELPATSRGGGSSPLVFHRSGFAKLSADDLDMAKLDGRINGKDVDAA
jgi:hypothetical protein